MMKWPSEATGQFTKMYILFSLTQKYDAFAVIEYMMYSGQKLSVFGVSLVRIQSKCVKKEDQNNSEYEHFSRSGNHIHRRPKTAISISYIFVKIFKH